MTETGPVSALLDQLLATALAKKATHLEITHAADLPSVRFWIEGEWQEQLYPSLEIHVPLVRRLGVMIGYSPPTRGYPKIGRLLRRIGEHQVFLLVLIERAAQLRALVELVDEAEFSKRKQPQPPSSHPYRR